MKPTYKKLNHHLLTATSAAVVLGCGLAVSHAADAAEEKPPEKPKWEGAVNAGLAMTSGNNDSVLATLGAKAQKKWEKDEFMLGVLGGYGESDDVKNTDFVGAYAQYNHLFTQKFYGGVRVDGLYDGNADLSYRFTLAPLAGYYFIKNDRTSLSVEAGPSYVIEKYFGEADNDSYLGIRFAQRFEHKITDITKFWEYADYTPALDDWADNYIINVEVGISTAMSKAWSLRVVGYYTYDSEPAPGREKGDFRLIAGTEYKF